jgi:hypothetical protein
VSGRLELRLVQFRFAIEVRITPMRNVGEASSLSRNGIFRGFRVMAEPLKRPRLFEIGRPISLQSQPSRRRVFASATFRVTSLLELAAEGIPGPARPRTGTTLSTRVEVRPLGSLFLTERLRPSRRWLGMDKQTRHEIMVLSLGTVLLEAPLLVIVALAILGQ